MAAETRDTGKAGTADVHGRQAEQPREIPKRGWLDIFKRVWAEQSRDNIPIVAAGVAFYFLLALFPLLTALVSIFGLVADPQQVEAMFQSFGGILPTEGQGIIRNQLQALASVPAGSLSFGLIVSLGFALWSTSRGVTSLIGALNIVYDEEERRGFITLNLTALALTISAILFILLAFGLVVVIPAVVSALGLEGVLGWALQLVHWPVLAVAAMIAMAVLYRYAPCRNRAKWRWVNWGAILATILWLLGSVAFSIYVSNFANYNETYGSLCAVVNLLLWFNLTAYAILIGAELNSEMEHQTARDTTEGAEKPMGQRSAYVADTLGEVSE